MRLRFILISISILLLGIATVGCGKHRDKRRHTGKIIAVNDTIVASGGSDTLRFGHLREGETAKLMLRLHNASSRNLALAGYSATCGCTKVEFENQPVKPGEEIPLSISFDSRGLFGWQFKLVELRLAGADAPFKIYLEAEVE